MADFVIWGCLVMTGNVGIIYDGYEIYGHSLLVSIY